MTRDYLCNCPVHAQTMMTPPTREQCDGIMFDNPGYPFHGEYRHWRHSCGCNVIGNTIVEMCVKCAANWP